MKQNIFTLTVLLLVPVASPFAVNPEDSVVLRRVENELHNLLAVIAIPRLIERLCGAAHASASSHVWENHALNLLSMLKLATAVHFASPSPTIG